jgi:hypothetical protein
MVESAKERLALEGLLTRVDALVSSISDREKILSAAKSQIDDFQQKSEKLLRENVDAMEKKLNASLSDDLKSTIDYTKTLYARFERMIWLAMVLLGAVSAFIGYQTFSSIPDKITAEIGKIAIQHNRDIEKLFAESEASIKKRNVAQQKNDETLNSKIQDFDRRIDNLLQDANTSATDKVGQIATNYDTQFRTFQIDAYVQTLQRQSIEPEVIRQLVQAFPTLDSTRQSRIVSVLGDRPRELPSNLIPPLKSILEGWKPDAQDVGARLARYQILVRYRSDVAKSEIQEQIKAAIASQDYDRVTDLVRVIWQVFSGGNPPSTNFDEPFFARRRVTDGPQIISDYLPVIRAALDTSAANRVLPMIMELRYLSAARNPEFDLLLAKTLAAAQGDPRTMMALIFSIRGSPEEGHQLYKPSIDFIRRSLDSLTGLPARVRGEIPSILISYAANNSLMLKSNDKLVEDTIDLLSKGGLETTKDGIEQQQFTNYLRTGNIFVNASKILLTNERTLQTISTIQNDDTAMTSVEIEKRETSLGEGVTVKIQRMSVDGADPRDERLGVEIAVDVEGNPQILNFVGSERFLLQSLPQSHIVEAKGQKVRFAIEIISQQIALMMGLIP